MTGVTAVDHDERIVELCQQNRSSGFAQLLLAYQERVYRRAYSFVRRREDALDITQEVFLKVIQAIPSLIPGRPLWPWLRRITTNAALNFLRRRPALLSLDDGEGSHEVSGGADPAEAAMAAWDWGQLQVALGRLPPLQRMAVILRHQEGLSYEEVARAMDLPLGTVKTYLFRARPTLRSELAAQEGWS